jgi:hypothetical protein
MRRKDPPPWVIPLAERRPNSFASLFSCAVCLFLLALVIFGALAILRGGYGSLKFRETARSRGAEAGRDEGRRDGEAAGYAAGLKAGADEAYVDTIDELYVSDQLTKDPFITYVGALGFFAFGFSLQWVTFFLLRRLGYLLDIDRMLVPTDLTKIDLVATGKSLRNKQELDPPVPMGPMLLMLLALPILGCNSPEEDAWQEGYKANHSAAYQQGWQEGFNRGRTAGSQKGKAVAEKAAATGTAWKPYFVLALSSSILGAAVGISAQFAVLIRCRRRGQLPEAVAVGLVPGMKKSVAYSILDRRRRLLIWWDGQVDKIAAKKEIEAAKMKAVKDAVLKKFKTVSSLEDFSQARLLELARDELSRIVAASEREAGRTTDRHSDEKDTRHKYACPHCHKIIAYKGKKGGKTVICPYKECGRPFDFPRLPNCGNNQET